MIARSTLAAPPRRGSRRKKSAAHRRETRKRQCASRKHLQPEEAFLATDRLTDDETHLLVLLLLADADEWNAAERSLDPRHLAACRQSLFHKLAVNSLADLVHAWSGGTAAARRKV